MMFGNLSTETFYKVNILFNIWGILPMTVLNLIDLLYLFDTYTYVEVRNHMDDSIIFAGEVNRVISELKKAEISYIVDCSAPFNYIVVSGKGRIIVYPDWEM